MEPANQSQPASKLPKEIAAWDDYALLDSGNQMKCERFGSVVLVRPEPLALWAPEFGVGEGMEGVGRIPAAGPWRQAAAQFRQRGEEGSWSVAVKPPEDWTVRWQDLRFSLRLASFKHTGVFPEQAANWEYLRRSLEPEQRLLNLFGYTGGATLAALSAGASAVHVDASRPAIAAARHNAELSGLAGKPVRWIEDDCVKFVQREARRASRYDCVVMDPPAFGRGPKKELWRFETGLLPLLRSCRDILNPGGRLLVNAYSMGFPALAVEQAVRHAFPKAQAVESVELALQERETERGFLLPAGITVRAVV